MRPLLFLLLAVALPAVAEETRTFLIPHKTNYLLFFTHDTRDHPDRNVKEEAKYQFSVKVPLYYDTYNLFFAYTQKAFWQVYDNDDTRPFREIDHAPELYAETAGRQTALMDIEKFRFGYEHESNGEGIETTRAWNRLFGSGFFTLWDMEMELKLWVWLKKRPKNSPDDPDGDETPGIRNYYGNGELHAVYNWEKYRLSAMVRDTLNSDTPKGAVELSLQGPMRNVDWYIQYWRGYGESVGMYDALSERIGFGIAFTR